MSRRNVNELEETCCVHCGESEAVTYDHVPPRAIFPIQAPNNLITVPSCKKCNEGASKDDEYFRLLLVSLEKNKGNSARDGLLPAVNRSLHRPQAQGLLKAFSDSIRPVERFTAQGLYAGTGFLSTTDGSRLDRTARRIVQGLFFHEIGEPAPKDHAVTVIHISRLPEVDPVMRELISGFISATLAEPVRNFGAAFSYWFLKSPNGPHRVHLALSFYGSLEYYAKVQPITISEEDRVKALTDLQEMYRDKGIIPPRDL